MVKGSGSGRADKKEELVNAVTHGFGSGLAVAALTILVVLSAIFGDAWHVTSFSIFGASLVILYSSSTLYHSFTRENLKLFFRKLDHMSIYLLIAGTYTPFCLTVLRGWIGWTIFGIIWGCCLTGIVVKAFFTGKYERLSTIMYVAMGWMILFAIRPLYLSTSTLTFTLLVTGGLAYTVGTYFFVNHRIRYNHGIWHLFVLAGSALHFFSVLSLLDFSR